MKKTWTEPSAEIFFCDVEKIEGDILTMPEEELMKQLIKCGYPAKPDDTDNSENSVFEK